MDDSATLDRAIKVTRIAMKVSTPFALLAAVTNPAFANSATGEVVASQSTDGPLLSASYSQSSRTLFIGAQPAVSQPGDVARVAISRASDLIGRPVKLLRPIRSNASAMKGPLGSGMIPTTMPLSGAAMTSGFGSRTHPILGGRRMHSGVDLAARTGSPIFATSDGRVSQADWNGGYGLYVALEHGSGVQTRYGHMSRLNVSAGQQVRKGDVIGYVGSTGRSTGPHLHYEVRVNGQAVNPRP